MSLERLRPVRGERRRVEAGPSVLQLFEDAAGERATQRDIARMRVIDRELAAGREPAEAAAIARTEIPDIEAPPPVEAT